jgi:hypothetical protein
VRAPPSSCALCEPSAGVCIDLWASSPVLGRAGPSRSVPWLGLAGQVHNVRPHSVWAGWPFENRKLFSILFQIQFRLKL